MGGVVLDTKRGREMDLGRRCQHRFFPPCCQWEKEEKENLSLDNGGESTTDPEQIQKLIYDYYKQLFGKQQVRSVGLSESTWAAKGRLTPSDNAEMLKPFSLEQCWDFIKENTAFQ